MRGGKLETVDPEEVEVGETIVVKPGRKIPLDGVVLEGTSFGYFRTDRRSLFQEKCSLKAVY